MLRCQNLKCIFNLW